MTRVSGIGSGIDIATIVKALVDAERAPKLAQLERLEKATTTRISAIGTLRSAASELANTLSALNRISSFDRQSVSSTSPSLVTATPANAEAAKALIGSRFSLQVEQLATGSKLAMRSVSGGNAATFNSGTLKLQAGSNSLDIEVSAGKNSLADIRDAINQQGSAQGFSASIITDTSGSRLVVTSSKTGEGNDVQVSATEDGVTLGDNSLLAQVYSSAQNFNLPELGYGASFKSGQLTINTGLSSFNVDIPVGSSLAQVRDAIATAGASYGVSASVEDTGAGERLVLASPLSGPISLAYAASASSLALPTLDPLVGDEFRQGTLNLSAGSESLDLNIDDGDTLLIIRDKINDAAGNFTATVESTPAGDRLVINSANGEAITVLGDDLGAGYPYGADYLNASQPAANAELSALVGSYNGEGFAEPNIAAGDPGLMSRAKSARFTIDGLQQVSVSNTVSGVVEGLTFNLVGAQSASDLAAGNTIDISVSNDRGSVRSNLQRFVEGYNKLVQATNQLTAYVQVGEGKPPVAGPLLGDSSIRNLLSGIRREFAVLGDSMDIRSLAELGITSNKDGTLSLNEATLNSAMQRDFEGVTQFLAGSNGVMGRLQKVVEPFSRGGGVLDERRRGLETTLSSVDKQRTALDMRIAKVEERLYSQYNAMDMLVGQLQKTSESLAGQLASLPGFVSKNKK